MTEKRSLCRAASDFALVVGALAVVASGLVAQTSTQKSARVFKDGYSIRDSAEITGEFRENGSCQVIADGVSVFQPSDSAQTTYIHGAAINVAPAGFDAHQIWCAPKRSDEPALPVAATERLFIVMMYAPAGRPAESRNYEVRAETATVATAPYRAGAALFGMSQQRINDTLPITAGMLYLVGTRGTVAIKRVTADGIVGNFSIRARASYTM